MRKSWKVAIIWDAILIGVPLIIAAILVVQVGWPLGNVRPLLLAIFAAEAFFVAVPATFYGSGAGFPMGGSTGQGIPSTYDGFATGAEMKREKAANSVTVDPVVIGPILAALLVGLTFLLWR